MTYSIYYVNCILLSPTPPPRVSTFLWEKNALLRLNELYVKMRYHNKIQCYIRISYWVKISCYVRIWYLEIKRIYYKFGVHMFVERVLFSLQIRKDYTQPEIEGRLVQSFKSRRLYLCKNFSIERFMISTFINSSPFRIYILTHL